MNIDKDTVRSEIYMFVKNFVSINTMVMIGNVEVDVVVPSHKISFKVYDVANVPSGYPGNYFDYCNSEASKEGYTLFHISTIDWSIRSESIKSHILKIFGKLPTVNLKNVTFAELPEDLAMEFYHENYYKDLDDGETYYALLKDGDPIAMVAVSEIFVTNYCEKKFIQVEDGLENIMMYMNNGFGPELLDTPFAYTSNQEFPILEKTKKINFNYLFDKPPHITFKYDLTRRDQHAYIKYTGSSHRVYLLKI